MSHIPTIFGMDGMDLSMLRIASDSTQKGRALPGRAFVESDDSPRSSGPPKTRPRALFEPFLRVETAGDRAPADLERLRWISPFTVPGG
jgi:hypothetical protein